MDGGEALRDPSGLPSPTRRHNPLLMELQPEDPAGSCNSSLNSSNRLQKFASGSVMRELAAYMRERCILGPERPAENPQKTDTPAAASAPTAAADHTAAAAGAEHKDTTSIAQGQGLFQSKGSTLNPSRPRLRVSLQPEVGQEEETLEGASGVRAPQDGESEESDGGEAVKSKTAAFGFLYDDSLDERDSVWVGKELRVGGGETDAVLSCPGCFLPICYQCQRQAPYMASLLLLLLPLLLMLLGIFCSCWCGLLRRRLCAWLPRLAQQLPLVMLQKQQLLHWVIVSCSFFWVKDLNLSSVRSCVRRVLAAVYCPRGVLGPEYLGCAMCSCNAVFRHESARSLFRAVAAFHVTTRPMPAEQQQLHQNQQLQQAEQRPAQQQQQPRGTRNAAELPVVQYIADCLSEPVLPSQPQPQKNQDLEEAPAVNEVLCESCGTVVGWQDADEVFHFTEVIPGEA